jgi:AraC-like DNA-binding protein
MKSGSTIQQVNFWRVQNISDLELVHAHYLNHKFPRHIHEEYIIGIIVQGVEEINHRGAIYVAPAGSLILINPGEPHSNYSINERGFTYRMFYPSESLLKQINFDLTGKEDSPLFSTPVIGQSDMFHSLLRLHVKLGQTSSALEQESEFISVMAPLIARHGSTDIASLPVVSEHRYVKIAREYLEACYTENLSLRQLASVSGISPFHLLRTFHEEIGLPPFEYQNQLRISRAKKLLRDGWSIADAAVETGFVDQSHLTKHFKRVVGITPGRYAPHRNKIQYSSREKT